MTRSITPEALAAALADGGEIALLDVREPGQIGEGQIFWSAPAPYSRFELDLAAGVPNRAVRLVLVDDGDGLAEKAAARAATLGYGDVAVLDGGVAAWAAAGHPLFKGVDVPGKAFGECVEHAFATPSISAEELARRLARGDDLVVIDGRPIDEYRKMTIPGSRCCPNGELPYRLPALVPNPATTVVINCAGRTRSILGTEILRSIGLPNPVLALENGTMGWQLAGFDLEHGADRMYGPGLAGPALDGLRTRARDLARRTGVVELDAEEAGRWLADPSRTTYLLDVRTAEEHAAGHLAGARHAPGGQLLQATARWAPVRGARLLLLDDGGERAPVVAAWLARAGHRTAVLVEGKAAWPDLALNRTTPPPPAPRLPPIDAAALAGREDEGLLFDLRPSRAHRAGHPRGARWSLRPRLAADLAAAQPDAPIVLIADDPAIAELAATEIPADRRAAVRVLGDPPERWPAAGLILEASPDRPSDAESIDHLFFVHDRHAGNLDAARRYLAWETGLIDQLETVDRIGFFSRLPRPVPGARR
ncbi:sulfurtransferase [Siculibacillus lacustris]|uniref:Sulfurtransferase n=1 Tax=Siculibacillus lacustris TaxID=1549641 RepID=A0A4Q9VJL0_9HYPH|nr:rhodanese-like domain-containing protein [Siculibacillus lacustris]TBW35524.1 sulfurtransferase [Siculibacillus lacustris]